MTPPNPQPSPRLKESSIGLYSPTDVALVFPHAQVPFDVVAGIAELGSGKVTDLAAEGFGSCREREEAKEGNHVTLEALTLQADASQRISKVKYKWLVPTGHVPPHTTSKMKSAGS